MVRFAGIYQLNCQLYQLLTFMQNISPQCPKTANSLSPIYRYRQLQKAQNANEQFFLLSLSSIASEILNSLQKDKEEYQKKMNAKQKEYLRSLQQQQAKILQMKGLNECLQIEKRELRLKLDQSQRYSKDRQMKIQLLNNKIKLLSNEVKEKQAVIKYLERKRQEQNNHNSQKMINNSLNNISISLEESFNTSKSKNLSFTKLKQTKLKFEDYANTSMQIQHKPTHQELTGKKSKAKRFRTESSYEVKQNRNQDNLTYKSKSALHDFVNSKLWTNSNDKTLAKKMRYDTSGCWMESSRGGHQLTNQLKSISFNQSAPFYKLQRSSFFSELPSTKLSFL